MRNEHWQALANRAHRRRAILRAGLGGVSLAADGLLSPGGARAIRWQAAGELPTDAAEEQVLRLQTGSSGSSSFDFQALGGGGDQEKWTSLGWLPPLYFDIDLNLQPAIFESWQPNEDATVWTFTIDPRAVWSDGSPITAADVKGSWELMAQPVLDHSRLSGYLGNVTGFDQVLELAAEEAPGLVAKDERTLEVQLNTTDPLFNWRIATVHLVPVKTEQARPDPENFWRPENNPVFSGPYMLEAFDPDQGTASMVKNPNWWMDEGPYLERIEYRFVTDPGTVAIMVQNNEVDAGMQALPPELQEQFPGWFRSIKGFGFNTFWLIPTVEPTDDLNVRKALIHAVNFEEIFQAAFPIGGGTMATQLLDADLPCTDEAQTWYPYDPEAAQAALAASPYGSAENLPRLRITPRGVNPHQNRGLEAVVEFWRQNLGITNIDFRQQPEAFGPDEERLNLTRDDVVLRFPDSAFYMFLSAHSQGPRASETMLGYQNPQVDELVNQALTIPPDDTQRCELALEAQRVFMDDYPVIFFGVEQETLNARAYVQNYERGPDRSPIRPWRIYIAQH